MIDQSVGSISHAGSVTVSPTSTTTYVLTVTDSYGDSVTQSVTVYVNSVSIVVQPQGLVTSSEAGTFFSVGASGAGTLSYKWFKDSVEISGATTSMYRVTESGAYTAEVTSTYRGVAMTITSSVANYLINYLTIGTQPSSNTVTLGNSNTFSVTATATGTLSYQWFLDGTEISGANSRAYVASAEGTYKVVVSSTVTGNTRTLASNDAVLTLRGATISSISPDTYVTQGRSVSLAISVSVSGGVTASFQWQLNGANISGANSIGLLATQGGDYTVVVTSSRNGVTKVETSSSTHVTAVAAPTITSFDSLASTIAYGGSTDLVPVFANGTGVITPGNISVNSGDHISVAPLTTTTYTLTAQNAAGSSVGMSYTITVTTGTFASVSNNSSASRYHGSTSITLASGKVLVYGNSDLQGTNVADLYSPTTNSFARVGDTTVGRQDSPGVILANGKVLVAGGSAYVSNQWTSVAAAELYDPATETWTATGSMNTARRGFFMVRLANGKVLVGGGTSSNGDLKSAETYDPATGIFTTVPDMPTTRADVHAALLPNGNVLVIGGYSSGNGHLATAVIFDTATNSWSTVSSQMQTAHDYGAAVVTLNDGRIFIAGGWSQSHGIAQTELFDPTTNTFSAGPDLSVLRADLTAHVLADGKVVLIGGADGNGNIWNTVDVYDPATSSIIQQFNTMNYERYAQSSALLSDGRILIVGGSYGGRFTAEIFSE